MPVTKSVERAMRAAARKQVRNKRVQTLTKTNVKKANKLILSGDIESAQTAVVDAISTLDRASEKKILHKSNAARKKSRLMKKLNKAQAAAKTTEAPQTE